MRPVTAYGWQLLADDRLRANGWKKVADLIRTAAADDSVGYIRAAGHAAAEYILARHHVMNIDAGNRYDAALHGTDPDSVMVITRFERLIDADVAVAGFDVAIAIEDAYANNGPGLQALPSLKFRLNHTRNT